MQKPRLIIGVVVASVAAIAGRPVIAAQPVGTGFTYQGQLKREGRPVTHAVTGCDFTFRLYGDESSDLQVGPELLRSAVVVDGLFAVDLDFGPPHDTGGLTNGVWQGAARWLEIDVQCPKDEAPTRLIPRQPITPTLYALHALGTMPVFNVRDFGAVGDGINDDAPAFNAAMAAVGTRGGTVVVPPTLQYYRLESTVQFKKSGTRLVGSANPGITSGPTLKWAAEASGGTMLEVPAGIHQPFIQGIRLDGRDGRDPNQPGVPHAGICLHLAIGQKECFGGDKPGQLCKSSDDCTPDGECAFSSIHRPRLEDLDLLGYQSYGLVLGEADEIHLNGGQLENVTGINLRFRGGGPGAIGLLINAQNAEWVNLIGPNFAPSSSLGFSNHRNHILVRAGAVNIMGMVSTRAEPDQFAIVSRGQIVINGWRSEDCKLIELGAVDPGGPIALENILQRGCPTSGGNTVIDIRTLGERPVSIRGASLRGEIAIPNAGTVRVSFDNVGFLFEGDGVVRTGGLPVSWNMAFQDVANGIFRLRAPEPTIQLEDSDENVVYRNIAGTVSGLKSMSMVPTDSPGVCDTKGVLYYDDSLNELCFCNGTSWIQIDGGGSCE
ncbi:MAG: hypothetical protein IH987_04620 [Planctomycetes bacterium]|nr:hypothetical protein [Planctomycetota bacterium]